MHITYVHEETGVIFHYSSDLSGDVVLGCLAPTGFASPPSVPAAALLAFADHVRKEPGDELTVAAYAEIGRTWSVENMIARDRAAGILPEAQPETDRDDLKAGAPEPREASKIPTPAQLGVVAVLASTAVSAGVLDILPGEAAALAAFETWIRKQAHQNPSPPEA